MTPLHIQIALHYFTRNEPYAMREPAHANSDATRRYTKELVDAGLLVPDTNEASGYQRSGKLRQYVEDLLAVQLPTKIERELSL